MEGLEPTLPKGKRILSPLRLPIPPLPLCCNCIERVGLVNSGLPAANARDGFVDGK